MKTTAQIEDDLTRALDTIRGLWPVLLMESKGVGVGSASSDEVTALDRRISLRHEVTLCLNGWARVIVEDRGTEHHIPLGHDTLGLCTFIARHAQWFSGHEAAHAALVELEAWAREIRATALPMQRDWLTLGPCPFVVDPTGADEGATHFCSGTIRGYADPSRDPHCTKCRQTAVVEWWETVFRATERFVTAEDLVRVIHREFGKPVKGVTIRSWVNRGWITAAMADGRTMTNETGANLFDAGAVIYDLTRRWAA